MPAGPRPLTAPPNSPALSAASPCRTTTSSACVSRAAARRASAAAVPCTASCSTCWRVTEKSTVSSTKGTTDDSSTVIVAGSIASAGTVTASGWGPVRGITFAATPARTFSSWTARSIAAQICSSQFSASRPRLTSFLLYQSKSVRM